MGNGFNVNGQNFGMLGNGGIVSNYNLGLPNLAAALNNTSCTQQLQALLLQNTTETKFSDVDSNKDGKIVQSEYEDYYIKQKENESSEVLRESNPKLKQYRNEAKNMFDAIAEKKYVGENIKGDIITEKSISEERFHAVNDVLRKDNPALVQKRLDIIKNEGPNADVFNGKTLGKIIDSEQYNYEKGNQPKQMKTCDEVKNKIEIITNQQKVIDIDV